VRLIVISKGPPKLNKAKAQFSSENQCGSEAVCHGG